MTKLASQQGLMERCSNRIEQVYITRDKYLAVVMNGVIHWIDEKLDRFSDREKLKDHTNIIFSEDSLFWQVAEEDGTIGQMRRLTKMKHRDENIFDKRFKYIKRSKPAPSGSNWWTLQEFKTVFLNQ